MKSLEKTKIRIKFELETTINASDSKNIKIVFVMKKVESVVQNIDIKQQKFQQVLAKQNRLSEIWSFSDRRENDLIIQKIRTVRALDELDLFSIDDDEAEPTENSAEMFFSQISELNNVDFSQILDGFDFSSIPISAFAIFQK